MYRSPWSRVAVTPPFTHLLGSPSPEELLAAPGRSVAVNGERLVGPALDRLCSVECALGFRLITGAYWYDPRSGAFGRMGQPTAGFLPPGLVLGGASCAGCSGGGTGIVVNGRELHDVDRRALERRLGELPQGRYFLDADGSFGPEGCAPRWALGKFARIDAA